ncbi:MAG: hypothetical protein WBW71_14505 [Bacteroidota bacterium]
MVYVFVETKAIPKFISDSYDNPMRYEIINRTPNGKFAFESEPTKDDIIFCYDISQEDWAYIVGHAEDFLLTGLEGILQAIPRMRRARVAREERKKEVQP